jgi:hypothetical protein
MSDSKPQVKAMLICDSVITEKGTEKNSLIGIFENINAKSFPCTHFSLAVYINFTDALGKYKFRLELADVENNMIIGHGETLEIEYKDKLASNNLAFVLNMLKFNRSGKYEFRFFSNGEICEIKPFNVKQI